MSRAIVFLHMPLEGAGLLGEFLQAEGIAVECCELQLGQPLPALEDFDLMLVMGGPQQVWQQAEHPWLATEIAAIEHWVSVRRKPYFGVCLGHQLLAVALGGSVGQAAEYELGFPAVQRLPGADNDVLLRVLPATSHWLQWHEAEVVDVPAGLQVMARSENCSNQVMSDGGRVVSIQFHAEGNEALVQRWTGEPHIASSMEAMGGPAAIERFRSEAGRYLPEAMQNAQRLFRQWLLINDLLGEGAA